MNQLYEKKTNARIQILETREEGYLVSNPQFPEDQYVIPFEVFESTYRPVVLDMTFGQAIEALKGGQKVARKGWNGKGMWLVLVPSEKQYGSSGTYETLIAKHPEMFGLRILPWIGMKTADNGFVPWLASQTDVLSEDWVIVEPQANAGA